MPIDLHVGGATVLVLGPGDELDRVIVRSLAEAGASTLATREGADHVDLTQHAASGAAHWISTEPDIDEDVARRLTRFLHDIDMRATGVVLRVGLHARERLLGLWPRPIASRRRRAELVQTVLAAMPMHGNPRQLLCCGRRRSGGYGMYIATCSHASGHVSERSAPKDAEDESTEFW